MKNIMPEVAALLGVEIGEEFDVAVACGAVDYSPYKFTKEGVTDCDGDTQEYPLWKLLTGEWKIIKKPWKPKDGDIFYYASPNGVIQSARYYDSNSFHYAMLYTGNCFRTEQEAEANREAITEKFGWQ